MYKRQAKFQIGSVGDINIDRVLTNDNGNVNGTQYTVSLDGGVTYFDAPAWGMLDYVYIRTYDTMADVINYASWEYDYD